MINNDDTFKLISLVEQKIVLYDKSQKLYSKRVDTKKVWDTIAREFNYSNKFMAARVVMMRILNYHTCKAGYRR